MLVGAGMFVLCSCTSQGSQQKEVVTDSVSVSQVDPVIETIMSRRSIRKYKPKAVEREKMQTIVECGINVNPAKRKAMAVKNEKRFLKQKRNALKNPGYSHHPVKTQASFKRLLKAV